MSMPKPSADAPPAVAADFRALYLAQYAFVWRSLRRMGVPDAQLEDAVQEVFLVVYRRRDKFDGSAHIRSWIYGIARRIASRVHRTQQRAARKLKVIPPPAEPPGPDRELERRRARAFMDEFLEELGEPRRTIFTLFEFEGLRGSEVAAALDMNVNTVYSQLRNARERLERAVKRRQRRIR